MKIRYGYISNSSSSSFCVIGNVTSNPLSHLLKNEKVMILIEGAGKSGDCADWSYIIEDKDSYDIIKSSKFYKLHENNILYILMNNDYTIQFDDDVMDNVLVTNKDIDGHIFAFNRDYSSPNNKKELKEFLMK